MMILVQLYTNYVRTLENVWFVDLLKNNINQIKLIRFLFIPLLLLFNTSSFDHELWLYANEHDASGTGV